MLLLGEIEKKKKTLVCVIMGSAAMNGADFRGRWLAPAQFKLLQITQNEVERQGSGKCLSYD